MVVNYQMNLLTKISSRKKKYISEFVKRQQALNKRIVNKLLWLSKRNDKLAGVTYVKKIHGELL
jgi:hypothetical protein